MSAHAPVSGSRPGSPPHGDGDGEAVGQHRLIQKSWRPSSPPYTLASPSRPQPKIFWFRARRHLADCSRKRAAGLGGSATIGTGATDRNHDRHGRLYRRDLRHLLVAWLCPPEASTGAPTEFHSPAIMPGIHRIYWSILSVAVANGCKKDSYARDS